MSTPSANPRLHPRAARVLVIVGVALFAYAFLGNYVALPGYLRFLARGGRSAEGGTADAAVVVGAIKTIGWMYSFHLGALCFALAHALRRGLPWRLFTLVALAWLGAWSAPWPAPAPWFYAGLGTVLLVAVARSIARAPGAESHGLCALGASLCFAFATWEACGLGTTGRMLHPAEATAFTTRLLASQSGKLMIELVAAWVLTACATRGAVHAPQPH